MAFRTYRTSFYNIGWVNAKYDHENLLRLQQELGFIIFAERLHSLFVCEVFELQDNHNVLRGIGDYICGIWNAAEASIIDFTGHRCQVLQVCLFSSGPREVHHSKKDE